MRLSTGWQRTDGEGSEGVDGQAKILEDILGQTFRAEKRLRKTEARIRNMTGAGLPEIPRKFSVRLARQKKAASRCRRRGEKILTPLPDGDVVSEIFQLRFLGLYGWRYIQDKTGISEEQCRAEYQRGFEILLADSEVQELVVRQGGAQVDAAQKQRPP